MTALRHDDLRGFFASPALRCRQTALAAASGFSMDLEIVHAIGPGDPDSNGYDPDRRRMPPAQGAVPQSIGRPAATAAILECAARRAAGVVVLVTHYSVILEFLQTALGTPANAWFSPGYCSISRFVLRDGRPLVFSLNETSYLDDVACRSL